MNKKELKRLARNIAGDILQSALEENDIQAVLRGSTLQDVFQSVFAWLEKPPHMAQLHRFLKRIDRR